MHLILKNATFMFKMYFSEIIQKRSSKKKRIMHLLFSFLVYPCKFALCKFINLSECRSENMSPVLVCYFSAIAEVVGERQKMLSA